MCRLTKRQKEVLQYVRKGMKSSEIAEELGISSNCVDYHIKAAMKKLGKNKRHMAARKAHNKGLL